MIKNTVIPKNVKQIDDGAFSMCMNLDDVEFEGDPLYIGNSFYNTKFYNSIKEDKYSCKYIGNHLIELVDKKRGKVIIKDGTVSIANKAFSQSKIRKIVFSKELKMIGESALGHCYRLEDVEFPDGLIYISKLCLIDCRNLKRVYIPKSVEDVGESILLGSGNVKEVFVSKEIAEKIDFYKNVKVRYID